MSKVFWSWKNSVETNGDELVIESVISEDSWWGDEATPQQLREELANHNGDLTVSLNSPGGDVFAGIAMYNALKDYKGGKVTIRVDGLAASIASVIAMAGDVVIMNAGSMMMIHKPWTFAFGNADELAKVQEVLTQIEASILPIYAARTGKSNDELQEMLDAETWFTAAEAVEQGFADEVIEPKKSAGASDTIKQMLNGGRLALVNKVTEDSTKHLLAKIKAEEEQPEPEAPKPTEEEEVEEPTPAETPSETPDEDEEPEKEPETPAEPTAPENNNNDDEEEQPTPSDNPGEEPEKETEVKDKKVETPENLVPAPADAPAQPAAASAEQYINSKQALRDFADVLTANAGKESADVKDAWNNHLVKMGITNPDVLLPGGVVQAIQDTLEGSTGLWGLVNKSGLTVFRTALNTVTGADSRARGHKRGNDKNEQVITLKDRVIRAQFVYKYITLDKETIRENEDTGAVVKYVLTELPKRILNELERAIVIGDGRDEDDEDKISSFLSLKEDAELTDGYATKYVQGSEDEISLAETFIYADEKVRADGARYAVTSRATLVRLKLSKDGVGAYVFPFGSNVAGALGLAGIFTPDFMSDDDALGYEFVPEAYVTVGDTSIEAYTNFLLKGNKQEYLQELYAGGALAYPRAAVAIVSES